MKTILYAFALSNLYFASAFAGCPTNDCNCSGLYQDTVYVDFGEGLCPIIVCWEWWYNNICQDIHIVCYPSSLTRQQKWQVLLASWEQMVPDTCCTEGDYKTMHVRSYENIPCIPRTGLSCNNETTDCWYEQCRQCVYGVYSNIEECACCVPCNHCTDIWDPSLGDPCSDSCQCKDKLGIE
jgi:hypothetical protein